MLPLSFNSLLYLFYRLSPFILVCFFVLGSIINSEAKGFMYLVGLIVTTVACYGINSGVTSKPDGAPAGAASPACSTLEINGITSETTPIGMVIFSYTFFYLVYPIVKHDLAYDNIPLLLFFPLLILGDIYWNMTYACFSSFQIFLAFIIAGGAGVIWAFVIESTNLKGLQYFNIGSNRERCSIATKGKYKCVTYVRGQATPALSKGDKGENGIDGKSPTPDDFKSLILSLIAGLNK